MEAQLTQINPSLLPRLPLLGAVLNLQIPDNELTSSFDAKLRKESLELLLVDCLRKRAVGDAIASGIGRLSLARSALPRSAGSVGRAIAALPVIDRPGLPAASTGQAAGSAGSTVVLLHRDSLNRSTRRGDRTTGCVQAWPDLWRGSQGPQSADRKDQPAGGRKSILYRGVTELSA